MTVKLMRQTASVDDTKTYVKVREVQNIGHIESTVVETNNGVGAKNTILTITTARPIEAGLVAKIGDNLYRITPNLIAMAGVKRYNLEINNG